MPPKSAPAAAAGPPAWFVRHVHAFIEDVVGPALARAGRPPGEPEGDAHFMRTFNNWADKIFSLTEARGEPNIAMVVVIGNRYADWARARGDPAGRREHELVAGSHAAALGVQRRLRAARPGARTRVVLQLANGSKTATVLALWHDPGVAAWTEERDADVIGAWAPARRVNVPELNAPQVGRRPKNAD